MVGSYLYVLIGCTAWENFKLLRRYQSWISANARRNFEATMHSLYDTSMYISCTCTIVVATKYKLPPEALETPPNAVGRHQQTSKRAQISHILYAMTLLRHMSTFVELMFSADGPCMHVTFYINITTSSPHQWFVLDYSYLSVGEFLRLNIQPVQYSCTDPPSLITSSSTTHCTG